MLSAGVVVIDAPLAATDRSRSSSGSVAEGEPGGFWNAAVAYGPDGTILDRYEKECRVPFGE